MALPITITLLLIIILTLTFTPLSLLAYSPTMTPPTPTDTLPLTNNINPKHIKPATLHLQHEQLKSAISVLINLKTNLPSLENFTSFPFNTRVLTDLKNLSSNGFTILAPPTPTIFNAAPPTYLFCLRAHILYGRLTLADLKSRPRVVSLVPYLHPVSVYRSDVTVSINGVRVSSPDLFVHPKLVVHGIDHVLPTAFHYCKYDDVNKKCSSFDSAEEDYLLSPFDGNCFTRAHESDDDDDSDQAKGDL